MLLLLVTGVCAMVAAGALGSWVIASPIRQLVNASRQIGSGRLFMRPELRTTSREVAQLGEELWNANQTLARRNEEQRKTEEVLRSTQRMESLGVLTGGIAHYFNNLLTAVLGNLNLVQMRLGPDPALQHSLSQAEKAVLQAAELTRQMLTYSGQGHADAKPLELNRTVQAMLPLLQINLSKNTVLRLELAAELPPILVDPAQLQQVVMNLVSNASEAIGPQEGTITLRTRAETLDQAQLALFCPGQDLTPGPYSLLEVQDDGCGMAPELLERIFEPFFTTRPLHQGLGLSSLQGILRIHHAGIQVLSSPGSGSTFKLLFRAASPGIPALPRRDEGSPRMFQGLALVADDEPGVLEIAAAALESMGFEVIQARDGAEAVAKFMGHQDRVSLVMLDIIMPRMGGLEALAELRKLHPFLPVILNSGYDAGADAQGLVDQGHTWFLAKPYPLRDLRRVVHAVLAPADGIPTPPAPPSPGA
jgi:signal transduction histidine kinase/CheY-like chemotaxis protein